MFWTSDSIYSIAFDVLIKILEILYTSESNSHSILSIGLACLFEVPKPHHKSKPTPIGSLIPDLAWSYKVKSKYALIWLSIWLPKIIVSNNDSSKNLSLTLIGKYKLLEVNLVLRVFLPIPNS